MELTPAVALSALLAVVVGVSLLGLALWRHKKAGSGEVKLIGESGQVETKLDPEGTIIVCGELWQAKSHDGVHIDVQTRIRVVGMEGHLVLVKVLRK